jgi:hypothetical protein
MQLGMLDHLHKWLFEFVKKHGRLDKYNAIWLSVPAYHDLTPKNKSYEEVSQWSGKEVKEMSRYLLGVVTQTLRGGTNVERPIFNRAIECTRALLEFYMYSRYKSHDEDTISYLEDALRRFHATKDVFLVGRVGKKAKAKATALRSELVKKRKAEEELHSQRWTATQKRREYTVWRDHITSEIDMSKENDAHFNFIKIHLMSHFAAQIRLYGSLPQWSAEAHEQAHKANLKDGWNASNHNLNYLPQVITFQRRILCFGIRELNILALARRRERDAKNEEEPPPPLSPPYTKPRFIGPQAQKGKDDGDALIKDFGALLDSTEDPSQREALYNGVREIIKQRSSNGTYLSDDQLLAVELCVYHGVKVEVEDLNGDRQFQICRCTGNQPWRGRDRRNDWVWVKQRQGMVYGALQGRLPWKLLRLFKLKHRNEEGCEVENWLAFAQTTVPENSGHMDPVSTFVNVRLSPGSGGFRVVRVGNIVGCAHVIPQRSFTDKVTNDRWIVNSHIDLMTWNVVYR